jgi:hypothetical protein
MPPCSVLLPICPATSLLLPKCPDSGTPPCTALHMYMHVHMSGACCMQFTHSCSVLLPCICAWLVCTALQSPNQDAVIDPVRGVTLKEGHSPGHKIQMRAGEQVRTGLHACTTVYSVGLACCQCCVCSTSQCSVCSLCDQLRGMRHMHTISTATCSQVSTDQAL